MIINSNLIIVFDLDDTLYNEVDFLKSAYKEIAQYLSKSCNSSSDAIYLDMINFYNTGSNTFEEILKTDNFKDLNINDLLNIYRNHKPDISISDSTHNLLDNLKNSVFKIGLITDGRSVQQRSKISALGLASFFDDIIISEEFGSEKPNINNYKYFVDKYGYSKTYVYIGDNTKKDFISPNNLGWQSICLLDNGKNIHKQTFIKEAIGHPHFIVKELVEIANLISNMS